MTKEVVVSNTVLVDLWSDDDTKIMVKVPFVYNETMKNLPSAHFDRKSELWWMPRSWTTYVVLHYTFTNELAPTEAFNTWLEQTKQQIGYQLHLRTLIESDGYPDLYTHQNSDIRFLANAKRAILANGLGSGKTRSAFSTVKFLASQGETVFPMLVVAPNSTKYSWKREIEVVWPNLIVTVVEGTATQRKKQLSSPAHVYIINWESVKSHSRLAPYGATALKRCQKCGGADSSITAARCHAHPKELNSKEFQTVIVDEAHRMKDPSAQQTRAVKAATGNAKYRFALTGTPIANAPDDLWSILNWLYPEDFPSRNKFIQRYLDISVNIWGGVDFVAIKKHKESEFFNILDPILRRMPKEVILPFLPPVVYERRDVEMSPKQRKAYETMRDRMISELDDGDRVVTTSPLSKMARMLQFASAYAEVETKEVVDKDTGETKLESFVRLSEPSDKLDAFMEDIDSFGDESVVVFSPSKQLINLLCHRFDKLKIPYGRITGDESTMDRQIHMDNFQDGKTKFILCTTGAGGTGITLTKASIAVYLGRPWSNIDSEQSEGRVHRLGSEVHDRIIYRDYITVGTVEEAVFDALTKKVVSLQTILRDRDIIRQAISEGKITIKEKDGSTV